MTEGSAKVYTKPSATGKPICDLLVGRVIDSHEHGWMVMDEVICSAWMMAKNG
jgi:NADPH-dependent curcumin reductase CurA